MWRVHGARRRLTSEFYELCMSRQGCPGSLGTCLGVLIGIKPVVTVEKQRADLRSAPQDSVGIGDTGVKSAIYTLVHHVSVTSARPAPQRNPNATRRVA